MVVTGFAVALSSCFEDYRYRHWYFDFEFRSCFRLVDFGLDSGQRNLGVMGFDFTGKISFGFAVADFVVDLLLLPFDALD